MQIVSYDSEWPKIFQAEKDLILATLGQKIVNIQHIGSTAIPGIAAKPIIDIAVLIENHQDAEQLTPMLSKIGYLFNSASTERHYYVKDGLLQYHLSLAYADRGGFWARQLLFRDYLIQHHDLAHEYEELKKHLLTEYPDGSQLYTDGKNEFVQKILALAQENKLLSELNESKLEITSGKGKILKSLQDLK